MEYETKEQTEYSYNILLVDTTGRTVHIKTTYKYIVIAINPTTGHDAKVCHGDMNNFV